MVKKLEEFAKGAWSLIFSRISTLLLLPLLMALSGIIISTYNETRQTNLAQLTAIGAVHAQISALIATLEGGARTQAAVDAAQEFRVGGLDMDIHDHEARIRVLESWRANVLSRTPPL